MNQQEKSTPLDAGPPTPRSIAEKNNEIHFKVDLKECLMEPTALSVLIAQIIGVNALLDYRYPVTQADRLAHLLINIGHELQRGKTAAVLNLLDDAMQLCFLHSPAYTAAREVYRLENTGELVGDNSAVEVFEAAIVRAEQERQETDEEEADADEPDLEDEDEEDLKDEDEDASEAVKQQDRHGEWVLRLCDAIDEGLRDERLADSVRQELADLVLNITDAYTSDMVARARWLLPVAIQRARKYLVPKHQDKTEDKTEKAAEGEAVKAHATDARATPQTFNLCDYKELEIDFVSGEEKRFRFYLARSVNQAYFETFGQRQTSVMHEGFYAPAKSDAQKAKLPIDLTEIGKVIFTGPKNARLFSVDWTTTGETIQAYFNIIGGNGEVQQALTIFE